MEKEMYKNELNTKKEENLHKNLQIPTWMKTPRLLQLESCIIKLSSNFFSVVNLPFQPPG